MENTNNNSTDRSVDSKKTIKRSRLVKPDQEAHKARLAALEKKIESLKKEQEKVQKEINDSRSKREGGGERQQLIERLNAIRKEQGELKQSKKIVFDRRDELQAGIKRLDEEIKALKSKNKYTRVEDIDKQIKAYENQIESGTMKLVDEKKLVNEVSSLKKSRKGVQKVEELHVELSNKRTELDAIRKQLADTNNEALNQEYLSIQAKLDELKNNKSSMQAAVDSLYKKKTELRDQIDQLYTEKKESIAKFRAQNNEFYERLTEERQQRIEQEKERKEQERRAKLMELAQIERENAEIPAYSEEISSCANLISYLQTNYLKQHSVTPLDSSSSSSSSAQKQSASALAPNANIRSVDASIPIPSGKVLVKKEHRNEEYFPATSSAAKSKKSKSSSASSTSASSSTKAIKLPLAVLDRFNDLKISPPTSVSQVSSVIDSINQLRSRLLKDQDRATAESRKKAEEKIAVLMQQQEEQPQEKEQETEQEKEQEQKQEQ